MPVAAVLGIDITTGEFALAVRSADGEEDYVAMKMQGDKYWDGDKNYPAFELAAVAGMLLELLSDLERKGWTFNKAGRMSVSCRQHDMVLLGEAGQSVLPFALSWQCNAATAEADEINASRSAVKSIGTVEPRLILPKLLHVLRKQPELKAGLACVTTTGDWVAYQLTGRQTINTSEAQSNGLFDLSKRKLPEKVLRSLGLKARWFPRLVKSGKSVGLVTGSDVPAADGEWAALRAKLADWEFLAGMGDNHASAVGCGVKDSQSVLVSAGTSGTINWVSKRFPPPKSGVLCFGFFLRNLWLLMLARCAKWYDDARDEFFPPDKFSHADLNRLALEAEPTKLARVLFHDGEHYPRDWSRLPTSVQVASVQFSIVLELLLRLRQMLKAMPRKAAVQRFILTGGLSQSDFFCHVFHTGVKLLVPDAEVLVSGRTGPLRYKTTAYGALVNAEFGGDVAAIPDDRFPTNPCPAPDDSKRQSLEDRLRPLLTQDK